MAALTTDRITEMREPGLSHYPMAASTIIYEGSIVCLNTAGLAIPAVSATGNVTVGIARARVDNSAGAAGDAYVQVFAPILARLPATSITQAMVGEVMHVVDDQTFDDAIGAGTVKLGVLAEFISTTDGFVWIDPAASVL